MKTSITTRCVSAVCSVGVTAAIFTAVISIAEQPQADGTVRLAHTIVRTQASAPVVVVYAETIRSR